MIDKPATCNEHSGELKSSLQNFDTRRQAQVKDSLERAAEKGEAI